MVYLPEASAPLHPGVAYDLMAASTISGSRCFLCMSNIVIIGGSSGIGLQLATQLASEGYQVTATYRNHPQQNATIHYHPLDVLSESADLSFLPDIIDGFVYCPGSISLKPFARIRPEDFVQDYQLQVAGAIKVLQAALPKMKNSTQASVVLFSTVAVQTGLPFHAQVAASKGAIEGLTKALAAELAPKVRVNCIAPSLTDTPLAAPLLSSDEKKEANAQRHPLKKIGTVTDIANMAAFLLSDQSGWMTGQVLHVDGGFSTLKV
jgi:NAD(P)-dependent dehydrogenase (short-subunit alcohol dehydrogenase family)